MAQSRKTRCFEQLVIDAFNLCKTLFYRFILIVYNFININSKSLYSPWGRKMRAIRDNENSERDGKNVVETFAYFYIGSAVVAYWCNDGDQRWTLHQVATTNGYTL